MPHSAGAKRWTAIQLLLLATVLWGTSFPTLKSILQVQQKLLPESSTWFLSAISLIARFGVAAIILAVFLNRRLMQCSRLEWGQGLGLGLFGGTGLLLQMDGLAYTSASNSAFLTQLYCLIIPLFVALRDHRRPPARVLVSCALVLAGVAILANFHWGEMRLGRGEWESLLGSILFSGQILWLERPLYRTNRTVPTACIMFGIMALACAPTAVLTTHNTRDWAIALQSPAVWVFIGWLVVFCTLTAYLIMNHWQPWVTATEAGLIYCTEPVFASLFALFLPGWFSAIGHIEYANEIITWRLLAGGGLITAANVMLQLPFGRPVKSPDSPAATPASKPGISPD